MVTKAPVVCMLLDGHKLETIIAKFDNSWQHFISKLPILCNSAMNRTHADMCFVYFGLLNICRDSFVLELVLCFWVVENTVKEFAIAVLAYKMRPRWVFVRFEVIRLRNLNLIPITI